MLETQGELVEDRDKKVSERLSLNKPALAKLRELLERVKKSQGNLMWFWRDQKKFYEKYFGKVAPLKGAVGGSACLEAKALWNTFGKPINTIVLWPLVWNPLIFFVLFKGFYFLVSGKDSKFFDDSFDRNVQLNKIEDELLAKEAILFVSNKCFIK